MQTLEILQATISNALLYGEHQALTNSIKHSAKHSAIDKINIYRDSMRETLIQTISDIYPVCLKLVGSDFFRAMTLQFIKRTISSSPDLNDFGMSFPRFISTFEPAKALSYLEDVARLEWAWQKAYIGIDNIDCDFMALKHISEKEFAKLIFLLPRDASLLHSKYPIHHIWQVNQDDYQEESVVNLSEGEAKLFIWRKHFNTYIDVLNDEEWEILNAIAQEIPLNKLLFVLKKKIKTNIIDLIFNCTAKGWINNFIRN